MATNWEGTLEESVEKRTGRGDPQPISNELKVL
jgi:hypothetical protein